MDKIVDRELLKPALGFATISEDLCSLKRRKKCMLEDEGYKLMGAAFEVYNALGYGMAEEIYQQSLEMELSLRGIPYHPKCNLSVFYKDRLLDTIYRPDLLVWDAIVVELKAMAE